MENSTHCSKQFTHSASLFDVYYDLWSRCYCYYHLITKGSEAIHHPGQGLCHQSQRVAELDLEVSFVPVDFNHCALFCRIRCQGKTQIWLKRLLEYIFEREDFWAWHHSKLFASLHFSFLPVTQFPRWFCWYSELPWPQGTSDFETPVL